jgi:CDP-2,3-bis-(O-geranylgeranyl)-sn-glycerol synthase
MDGDMDVLEAILVALTGLWLFLPAMAPNSAAVLTGGGAPVDFGRSWKGRRILGDGKTWRGFFGGALAGIILGLVQIAVATPFDAVDYWGFGPLWGSLGVLTALAVGSLLGDMLGSFIKRRMNLERGAKAPILDQYDFLIGAFLVTGLLFPGWVYAQYIEGGQILALVFLLLITPVLHRVVNVIGYKMGQKDVPW